MRVLVLGGAGFIGRHTVVALLARGHQVVIGSRYPERAERRLPAQAHRCERRRVRFEQLRNADVWRALISDVDVVINCVGILRERAAETYDKVHHLAPAALADACIAAGIRRLIHVSALGLDEHVTSGFLTSKRRGEQALFKRQMDCIIVRPSLLDGDDGYGARWFRKVARWPVHLIPASARGQIAPLDIDDLAEALAVLCETSAPIGREVELGGAEQLSIPEYLMRLRIQQGGSTIGTARVIEVPHWLARIASHVCDLLHITPYSFGHLQLMQHDNVPREHLLPELLRAGRRAPVTGKPTPTFRYAGG